MEDKRVFLFAIKAGLTISLLMIVLTFTLFFADVNAVNFWHKLWIGLFQLLLICAALFYFSHWVLPQRATMIQTLVASLTMGLVYFVIFYLFEAVYVHWIDSAFMEKVLNYKSGQNTQLSYEQISALRLEIESEYAFSIANFIKQFFYTFVRYTTLGLVFGYIFANKTNINTSY